MKRLYDISPALTPATRVYPGDQSLEYTLVSDMVGGDPLNLMEYAATTHLGAHLDAPRHYIEDGKRIGDIELERLMGRCQVVRVNVQPGKAVYPEHLPEIAKGITRLLLSTNPAQDFEVWSNHYAHLSMPLVNHLLKHKIKLVGIDSPSVDAFDASTAPIHKALLSQDVLIMENLDLNEVPEGVYELVALPLKLTEAEAAPLRAVLMTNAAPSVK